MSERRRFLLYLVAIHAVFLALGLWLLRDRIVWLVAVEAFFLISLIFGLRLVHRSLEPMRFLESGEELLRSSDFTTRFRETGQRELDRLLRLFNGMIETLRDERVQAREQEQLLIRIAEISPSGMIALDYDGRLERANPAACSLLGVDEAPVGKALEELDAPFAHKLSELGDGASAILPLVGARRVRVHALSFVDQGFSRRFFLLEELTAELRASEKAAYEKLIRIMAHETNNTGGAVISLLRSCLRYADQLQDNDRNDFVDGLEVAIRRNEHMNEFMRSFADVVRLPPPRREEVDLRALLADVRALYAAQLEECGIVWHDRLDEHQPRCSCDRTQMEQVLTNIVKNAIEAVGRDGEIVIDGGSDGDRGWIQVEDTGGGVPDEVSNHLFASFYTTKPEGRGIGLTLVREILLAHEFDFSLETVGPGRAGFCISYPRN